MSIPEYYGSTIDAIERELRGSDKHYIREVEIEKLVAYYVERFSLPLLIVKFDQAVMIEDEKVSQHSEGEIQLTVGFPIMNEPGIDEVVSRRANPYHPYFSMELVGDKLQTTVSIKLISDTPEQQVNEVIRVVKEEVSNKNSNVKEGNGYLEHEVRRRINELKAKYARGDQILQRITERIPIKLEKRSTPLATVDFQVKKKILPIMPSITKNEEPQLYLEKDKIEAVIELLGNGGRSCEITPRVFSKLQEEDLRDVLLSWLNAVFEGQAGGETFSKKGKTDIHLLLSNGEILICECKIWNGEKYVVEGIEQLFDYLTWRENFGIIIVFCKQKSFSDLIAKTRTAVEKHSSFVKGSLIEKSAFHFAALHVFPEDDSKRVEVHYLLFNLYYE